MHVCAFRALAVKLVELRTSSGTWMHVCGCVYVLCVCVLQAFEKIQQATGIEEIDRLVESFISAEGQNYTL